MFFHDKQCPNLYLIIFFCPFYTFGLLLHIVFSLMVYTRMAWSTIFMRISIPIWDSSLFFHSCIFYHTFSLIHLKLLYFDLLTKARRPRYLSKFSLMVSPYAWMMDCLTDSKVLVLNMIADFLVLATWLEAFHTLLEFLEI